ncbi:MAG: flippase [Dehalococcoidia bacterium]
MARAATLPRHVRAAPDTRHARHSLGANALWMFGGQLITWGLTTVTLALLPRYLGPEQFGQLGIGVSFSNLAVTFGGLGIGTYVTREIARDRSRSREVLATAFWLSLLLGTVAAALAVGTGLALGYSRWTMIAIAANAAGVPFSLLLVLAYGALQGAEIMRYQALLDVGNKLYVLVTLVAIAVLDLGFGVYLAVSWGSAFFCAIACLAILRQTLGFAPLGASFRLGARMVVESIPFASVGIFVVAYLAADQIMLSKLAGEHAVGIYRTPSQIFGTLLFAPTVLTTVIFPRLAATGPGQPAEFARLTRFTLAAVLAMLLPVAVLCATVGGDGLRFLVGDEYAESGAVMALLGFALIPTGVNMVVQRVLNAADRQWMWTWVMAAALVVKVAINAALIPLFDHLFGNPALGAAAGLILVEAAMAAVAFRLLPVRVFTRPALLAVGKIVLAGLLAAVAIWVASGRGWVVAGMAGASVYVAAAWLLRAYTLAQIAEARGWLGSRSQAESPPDPERSLGDGWSPPLPLAKASARMKGPRDAAGARPRA